MASFKEANVDIMGSNKKERKSELSVEQLQQKTAW